MAGCLHLDIGWEGKAVLAHISLRPLGWVFGGAVAIIQAAARIGCATPH